VACFLWCGSQKLILVEFVVKNGIYKDRSFRYGDIASAFPFGCLSERKQCGSIFSTRIRPKILIKTYCNAQYTHPNCIKLNRLHCKIVQLCFICFNRLTCYNKHLGHFATILMKISGQTQCSDRKKSISWVHEAWSLKQK
jgi:hypothetical protein